MNVSTMKTIGLLSVEFILSVCFLFVSVQFAWALIPVLWYHVLIKIGEDLNFDFIKNLLKRGE